jgi:hypothetical protein
MIRMIDKDANISPELLFALEIIARDVVGELSLPVIDLMVKLNQKRDISGVDTGVIIESKAKGLVEEDQNGQLFLTKNGMKTINNLGDGSKRLTRECIDWLNEFSQDEPNVLKDTAENRYNTSDVKLN